MQYFRGHARTWCESRDARGMGDMKKAAYAVAALKRRVRRSAA